MIGIAAPERSRMIRSRAIFGLGLSGAKRCLVLMVLLASGPSMYDLKQRIAAAGDGCGGRLA
jgi:hypothetical protein